MSLPLFALAKKANAIGPLKSLRFETQLTMYEVSGEDLKNSICV